ncbi:MAG: FkbM family methyltransferase [Alphaproteobacteria bacterium]|nr:FkbM family methyltransferase [Alphaproteobacteria bacterium]
MAAQNTKCKLYHSEFTKYDKEIFSRSSSIYANKSNVVADNYTEIECIDLCEFIDNLKEPVDLLKMDVEGAEFDILYKMITQGTYKKVKTILVEKHDDVIPDIVKKAGIVKKLIREKNIQNIDLNWR